MVILGAGLLSHFWFGFVVVRRKAGGIDVIFFSLKSLNFQCQNDPSFSGLLLSILSNASQLEFLGQPKFEEFKWPILDELASVRNELPFLI
jgi:hypothetical protein